MIVVKKINHQEIIVNCDQIEWIEFTPHAVMSLASGEKIIVDETPDDIIGKVIEYKRAIHARRAGIGLVPPKIS
jgi:flagellar protein FlbD